MDIRALSQLMGGKVASSAVAVPVDTRAVISEIASSTSLSDGERSGLISAIASVDQNLLGATRATVLKQAQNLGIYLRNTSANESFPRWSMMTALRAYGMNLQESTPETRVSAGAVRVQLETIAQSSRGVSLDTAVAAASRMVERPVVTYEAPDAAVAVSGARVEKIA